MKTLWFNEKAKYDGSQLRCQYAYFQHGVLGDSIVSWRGPCDVKAEYMADGEDVLAQSEIRGSDMVHFIVEAFDERLRFGVALQRLLTSVARDIIESMNTSIRLRRVGDDLFYENKKLSISVAAQSPLGVVIHFALNVSNEGTPVPTCSLEDFDIAPDLFAQKVMKAFAGEYESLLEATMKVKPLTRS